MSNRIRFAGSLRRKWQLRSDTAAAERHMAFMGYDQPREVRAARARQLAERSRLPVRRLGSSALHLTTPR